MRRGEPDRGCGGGDEGAARQGRRAVRALGGAVDGRAVLGDRVQDEGRGEGEGGGRARAVRNGLTTATPITRAIASSRSRASRAGVARWAGRGSQAGLAVPHGRTGTVVAVNIFIGTV